MVRYLRRQCILKEFELGKPDWIYVCEIIHVTWIILISTYAVGIIEI